MVTDPRSRLNPDAPAQLALRTGSARTLAGRIRSVSSGRVSAGRGFSNPALAGLTPPRAVPPRSALDLLAQARAGLAEAAALAPAGERYAGAHLAALRGAAAVLAARTHPQADPQTPQSPQAKARRRKLRSAWDLLCEVAPETAEWAAFFAAGAAKRAAAEAGVTRAVSVREADDLVRDVQTFLAVVATTIGAVVTTTIGAVVGATIGATVDARSD